MKFFLAMVLCVFGLSLRAQAKAKGPKTRPKYLNGEATVKGNTVDFGDTQIDGGTRTPMMTAVGAGNANKNYDFVKIRLRWHPEMVASAAQLD